MEGCKDGGAPSFEGDGAIVTTDGILSVPVGRQPRFGNVVPIIGDSVRDDLDLDVTVEVGKVGNLEAVTSRGHIAPTLAVQCDLEGLVVGRDAVLCHEGTSETRVGADRIAVTEYDVPNGVYAGIDIIYLDESLDEILCANQRGRSGHDVRPGIFAYEIERRRWSCLD